MFSAVSRYLRHSATSSQAASMRPAWPSSSNPYVIQATYDHIIDREAETYPAVQGRRRRP